MLLALLKKIFVNEAVGMMMAAIGALFVLAFGFILLWPAFYWLAVVWWRITGSN